VTWFDAATGKVLRSIQKPNLRTAELTEDGSDVLLVSQWGNKDGITRVSYKTGKKEKNYGIKPAAKAGGIFSEIRRFMTNGQRNRVNSQAYAVTAKLSEDGSELNALMMEMSWRSVPSGLGNTMEQEMSLQFVKMEMESGKRLETMKFKTEDFGFSKNEWVQTAAIRPDGLEFAIAHGTTVYVVDTQTGETTGEYPTRENGQIQLLGYSPKGRFLAASGYRGLFVWDVASGEVVKLIEEQGNQHFSFSKDGSRMVTSAHGKNSTVRVFDTNTWKRIIDHKQTQADRSCIVLSDDGQKVLFGLADCRLEIWDLAKMGN
jgi:WD40 repeat protein